MIRTLNLCKTYRRGQEQVEALRGVSLEVPAGAFALLLGPSGCGKSTLLHLLGGMDQPTQGEVWINDMQLQRAKEPELARFRSHQIGFIFQFYNLLPSLNALDNVVLPLLAQGMAWKPAREQAAAVLEQVGLSHRLKHNPAQLSGGEQQRVAIARALVIRPALILADEPTGDLDSVSAQGIIELMVSLNLQNRLTFVVATHNEALTAYASHCFRLRDGRLDGQKVPHPPAAGPA